MATTGTAATDEAGHCQGLVLIFIAILHQIGDEFCMVSYAAGRSFYLNPNAQYMFRTESLVLSGHMLLTARIATRQTRAGEAHISRGF